MLHTEGRTKQRKFYVRQSHDVKLLSLIFQVQNYNFFPSEANLHTAF